MIILNVYAILIAVVASLGAFAVRYAGGWNENQGDYYTALTGMGVAVVADLVVRGVNWKRIIAQASIPNIITPQGLIARKRQPMMEMSEALVGGKTGGTVFFVLPVWLACVLFFFVIIK